MPEKTKMIRIKWVRSGIGFTRHQKTIVRSLGLYKLNHTVVRPDTPQIRGIVAAVPHLLEIVPEPSVAAWASIPEYTVHAPVAVAASPAQESAPAESAAETAAPEHAEASQSTSAPGSATPESSPEAGDTAQGSKE